MRKARIWGLSLMCLPKKVNDIYEVYTTEEILKIDTYTKYPNYNNMAGWVEAEEGWEVMFTQVYEDEVEWLE